MIPGPSARLTVVDQVHSFYNKGQKPTMLCPTDYHLRRTDTPNACFHPNVLSVGNTVTTS